jgi:predicted ATPase
VQTNWCVITGAPCSGKTTLIDQLAEKGYRTVPEAGRQYFEGEIAKGRTIDEIRADPAAMTRQIYALMLEQEAALHPEETVFLDRGLPDAPAFFRIAGMDPNETLSDCTQHRYAAVFLLDRFPYHQDGVRTADDETAEYFDSWMERDYRALGYEVIRVPVLPQKERLAFVLERLPA